MNMGHTTIFDSLTFPALRNLHLIGFQKSKTLDSFLSRHAAHLHTLSSCEFAHPTSIESLRGMSRLTDLKLSSVELPLLHTIFRELQEITFLPQLRRIALSRCLDPLHAETIKMAARGLAARAQILSFRLEYLKSDAADKGEELERCLASLAAVAAKGMRIYVGNMTQNYISAGFTPDKIPTT
ncbi:hypothetical protein C8R43DRAFT_274561 [Mycena crocata]|nr:hypothetical protein C8R43DRAFT_274561 [Mycena crocata]